MNSTDVDDDVVQQTSDEEWSLHFIAKIGNGGEYVCKLENRIGSDQQIFEIVVVVSEESHAMTAVIAVLIVIAALLVFIIRMLYTRCSVSFLNFNLILVSQFIHS